MYISFNVELVYNYLVSNGFVYTVRHWPAEKHPHNNFTHPVKRGSSLVPDLNVQVKTIEPFIVNGKLFPYVLDEFFEYSGFKSSAYWFKAIKLKPDMWMLKAVVVSPGVI